MKEGRKMSRLYNFVLHPLVYKIFLGLLACVYVAYLVVFGGEWYVSQSTPLTDSTAITVDVVSSPSDAMSYWSATTMSSAVDADTLSGTDTSSVALQASTDTSRGNAARHQGQAPKSGESSYPLSTVGKVFMTNNAGQNFVCSGTAVVSKKHNVVDTAGHCLYNGGWVHNVIFCPLFANGTSPYGCWAARDLEVPSGWINRSANDLHQDFGMAIVAANSQGDLTDVVGGAGWAYNQSVNQTFYAYGYPAAPPYDGQTRQSCDGANGKSWQHGGGMVVSIPCKMTGGSSGGPWFIKNGGNWYVDGHNDFKSSIQPDHMFSPYYDDTWYALYNKAQNS